MGKKITESSSPVGKGGAYPATTEETKVHVLSPSYSPHAHAPLPDEVSALVRKVVLKFDFLLVFPIVTMLCQCQYEYR